MKKMAIFLSAILVAGLISSFTNKAKTSSKVRITITADHATTFDMLQDNKVIKGLSTPFELNVSSSESKFIFKAQDSRSVLKVNVERENKIRISSDWPVTVVLINAEKISSFGMF